MRLDNSIQFYLDDTSPHMVICNEVDLGLDPEDYTLNSSIMWNGHYRRFLNTNERDEALASNANTKATYRRITHSFYGKFVVNEDIYMTIDVNFHCDNLDREEDFHMGGSFKCPLVLRKEDEAQERFTIVARKIRVQPVFKVDESLQFSLYPFLAPGESRYNDRTIDYFFPRMCSPYQMSTLIMPQFIDKLSNPKENIRTKGNGINISDTIVTSILNTQDIPYEIALEEGKKIEKKLLEKVG